MSVITCTNVARSLLVVSLQNSAVFHASSRQAFFHNMKFPNFILYEIFPVYHFRRFMNFVIISNFYF
jgi:hypothetical protein